MPSTLGPEIHLPKHTGDACVRLFGGLHWVWPTQGYQIYCLV